MKEKITIRPENYDCGIEACLEKNNLKEESFFIDNVTFSGIVPLVYEEKETGKLRYSYFVVINSENKKYNAIWELRDRRDFFVSPRHFMLKQPAAKRRVRLGGFEINRKKVIVEVEKAGIYRDREFTEYDHKFSRSISFFISRITASC